MLHHIDEHFLSGLLLEAFDDDAWRRLDVDAALGVEPVVDFAFEAQVLLAGERFGFGAAAQLLFHDLVVLLCELRLTYAST